MLTHNGKIYRNLEEQVLQNHDDLLYLMKEGGTLNEFGIKVVGKVDSVSQLPSAGSYSGEYGDAYAVGTTTPYTFYIFTRQTSGTVGDYWFNIGQFPVPSTVPGPEGPQGPEGPKGDRGSQWFSGNTDNPSSGAYQVHDKYINTSNGNVFTWTGDKWSLSGNIRGAQGPQGVQGPAGPIGAQGPQGPQGNPGENGQSFIIAGTLANTDQLPAPTEENRTKGYLIGTAQPYDLYVVVGTDTLTWKNVGRVEGVVGPVGPQGPQGERGPAGPEGIEGPEGRRGPEGPEGPRGEQGIQGPIGPQGEQGIQGVQGDSIVEVRVSNPVSVAGGTQYTLSYRLSSGPNFISAGTFTAPQGIQGIQGEQGLQGPAGVVDYSYVDEKVAGYLPLKDGGTITSEKTWPSASATFSNYGMSVKDPDTNISNLLLTSNNGLQLNSKPNDSTAFSRYITLYPDREMISMEKGYPSANRLSHFGINCDPNYSDPPYFVVRKPGMADNAYFHFPDAADKEYNIIATKKYVDSTVASISQFKYQVVDALPETGEVGIIYLVPHSHGESDTYDEYVWVDGKFEKLGNADLDLSNYYNKAEIDATVNTINTNVSTNTTNIATLQTDKADKTELQALSGTVEGMYTNEQVDSAISTSITTALEPYSTTTEMNTAITTALQPYSTTDQMNTAISNSLTPYATTEYVTNSLTPYATQTYVNDAIGGITGFEYQVVESLPETGEKGIIYLVAHEHGSGDGYDEYIWVDTKFEKIGTTDIDLSQYATKTELADYAKKSEIPDTSSFATIEALNTTNTNVETNATNILDLQQTKANQSELANYLPLTGGNMDGSIIIVGEKDGYLKYMMVGGDKYYEDHVKIYQNKLDFAVNRTTSRMYPATGSKGVRIESVYNTYEFAPSGRGSAIDPKQNVAVIADITSAIQSQEVEITDVPETATQGTLTTDQLTALQSDDSHFIMFNHEKYYLEDKGHTAGYLTYSHVGYENSKHMLKTITVTISTGAWVLNTTEVGGGGGGKTFINPTNSLLGVVVSPNSTTTNTTIAEDLKGAQFMQMYDTENFATITVPANSIVKFPNGGFVSFNPDTGEITFKNQSDSSIAFSYFAVNILIYK